MTFTVNVLLTCILYRDAGPALIRNVCISLCPRTFFFGDAVVLLRESYTLEKFLCFLQLFDRTYVCGARCTGIFLL